MNHLRFTFFQLSLRTHLLAEGRRRALRASAFAEDALAVLEAGIGNGELDEARRACVSFRPMSPTCCA